MPTIRGADLGSKKRYAGQVMRADGTAEMVFKGLETVRTDWSPLAQQFQQTLYAKIFNREPYRDYVRDTVRRTLAGELDEQLVYRKRLRRQLDEYQRNVPPHGGRHASPTSTTTRQAAPVPARRLDQLPDDGGRPRATGNAHRAIDYEHYVTRQLQPIADAILPFLDDDFETLLTGQMTLFPQ
jgi:DNA polymerase-2